MTSALPTRSDLAAAINAGLSLYEMGQRLGHPSLTIARLLYGHYTQAVSLAELEDHALYHYMSLRRDATRLCQKNGLSPFAPRKEEISTTRHRHPPRSWEQIKAELPPEQLTRELAVKSKLAVAQAHGIAVKTLRRLIGEYAQAATAPQSPVEAPGSVRPPETTNEPSDPSMDKPAPESESGKGIGEGVGLTLTGSQILRGTLSSAETATHAIKFPTTTFAAQIDQEGIDIRLSDTGLSPAEVRQYLRVAEGPLELAGEGLELSLTIRGPRR